jgi:transcriptional regulator with XRE-family HTH domain
MEHPTLDGPDGFAARLRYVVDSYGSANALAVAIQRSEGALRKWLRGKSEPTVSDLWAICEAIKTDIAWLVTGRGDPKGFGIRSPARCSRRRATIAPFASNCRPLTASTARLFASVSRVRETPHHLACVRRLRVMRTNVRSSRDKSSRAGPTDHG